jgi:hypothetical protein
LLDDFWILNFFGRTRVTTLWIIYMDPSFMHSYETVKQSHEIAVEVGPEWLLDQALDHTSDQSWDIWEPISPKAFSCLNSRE